MCFNNGSDAFQAYNLTLGQNVPLGDKIQDDCVPILDAETTRQILTMVQSGTPNSVINGVRVQNGLTNNQVCYAWIQLI